MKRLYCDYVVPGILDSSGTLDWWSAMTITNHVPIEQTCELIVKDFNTGNTLRELPTVLGAEESVILTRNSPAFTGLDRRLRVYIDCPDTVTAKVGNSRGTTNSISWENMQELSFPNE